jgi:hypothetical protein
MDRTIETVPMANPTLAKNAKASRNLRLFLGGDWDTGVSCPVDGDADGGGFVELRFRGAS